MKNGEEKSYYINGKLREIINWKDGKLEGEYKWYYKSGKLRVVSYYKDDKLEGERKYYYRNGKEEITYWKNGKNITEQVIEKKELLERIKEL
jgi:antitoxin component YwqK of YwqJK toxin-antitoxin module